MIETPYNTHTAAAAKMTAGFGVITLSDTRMSGNDLSGRKLIELIEAASHKVTDYRVIPDSPADLQTLIQQWIARSDVDAIITNGGTGVGRRDSTIDAVAGLLDTPLPGFGELFRMLSWEQIGSGALLSRAVGGIAKGKPLFALPGSPAAVDLAATRLILPEIRHILHELRR